MKTIRSRIFTYGIISLVENTAGFWAVRRRSDCPNCDWMPISRLPASLEEAKERFGSLAKVDFMLTVPEEDDLWDWLIANWEE